MHRKQNLLEQISFIWCYKSVGMNGEQSGLKNIRSCVISGIIWNSMLKYFIPCYEEKCYVLWLLIVEIFFFCWEKISAKKLLPGTCTMQYRQMFSICTGYVTAINCFSYFQLFSILFRLKKIKVNIQKPLRY